MLKAFRVVFLGHLKGTFLSGGWSYQAGALFDRGFLAGRIWHVFISGWWRDSDLRQRCLHFGGLLLLARGRIWHSACLRSCLLKLPLQTFVVLPKEKTTVWVKQNGNFFQQNGSVIKIEQN
jgi:hypothetical protein